MLVFLEDFSLVFPALSVSYNSVSARGGVVKQKVNKRGKGREEAENWEKCAYIHYRGPPIASCTLPMQMSPSQFRASCIELYMKVSNDNSIVLAVQNAICIEQISYLFPGEKLNKFLSTLLY